MQPVITHSITDLKSCEAVLKIMLAKNPNVGMLIVSEQARRRIADEINSLALRYSLTFRGSLSVMGVKLRTREEQDAFEAAQKALIERNKAQAQAALEYQQQVSLRRLEAEKMLLTKDQFNASKPLEKWVEYKRTMERLRGA